MIIGLNWMSFIHKDPYRVFQKWKLEGVCFCKSKRKEMIIELLIIEFYFIFNLVLLNIWRIYLQSLASFLQFTRIYTRREKKFQKIPNLKKNEINCWKGKTLGVQTPHISQTFGIPWIWWHNYIAKKKYLKSKELKLCAFWDFQ